MNENENELRKIEARIAIELFGYKWVAFEWQTTADGLGTRRALLAPNVANEELANEGHWMADGSEKPYEYLAYPVPRYARDISAAMEAAEKMRELWKAVGKKYRFRFHELDEGMWSADIIWPEPYQSADDSVMWEEYPYRLPEAIARCIVAALDAEVKA